VGAEAARHLFGRNGGHDDVAPSMPPDPERVAWQRNRLLARLRARSGAGDRATPSGEDAHPSATAGPNRPRAAVVAAVARIAAELPRCELAAEHPAVVASALRGLDRAERVAALRALPGPLARQVLHRLRAS
jgi:hypothetical protein